MLQLAYEEEQRESAMSAQKTLLTAEELLRLPGTGYRYELVKGELIKMPPAGAEHGGVSIKIASRLNVYVEAHKLGAVFAASSALALGRPRHRVGAPDAAFLT